MDRLSHLTAHNIVVLFVTAEDKWKRWRVGPLIKLAFWSRLRALKRNFPTDQMLCSNVGIYWSIQKVEDDNVLPIDTVSNLVFWSRRVNKFELLHTYCLHIATITKPSNLHLIKWLQFSWFTSSSMGTYVKTIFGVHSLCTACQTHTYLVEMFGKWKELFSVNIDIFS